MRSNAVRLIWALILASFSTSAFAHAQVGQATGFLTGFLHPLTGLDHIIAMVAVGLWGAQLGAPAIWMLPVTFPMVMAFGGFLGQELESPVDPVRRAERFVQRRPEGGRQASSACPSRGSRSALRFPASCSAPR